MNSKSAADSCVILIRCRSLVRPASHPSKTADDGMMESQAVGTNLPVPVFLSVGLAMLYLRLSGPELALDEFVTS